MGLELVLDESAAAGKAALTDGAVEGQQGGVLTAAMLAQFIFGSKGQATGASVRSRWKLNQARNKTYCNNK